MIYGKGYMGKGKYNCTNSRKIRVMWENMFNRCYNKTFHLKSPTYIGCVVHEDWYNFQNFAKWYEENYIEGWVLDKDILSGENKTYGPETCCFVPQKINNLFLGAKNKNDGLPRGVSRARGKKFISRGSVNGVKVILGTFDTIEEAYICWKNDKNSKIKNEAIVHKDKLNEKVFNILIKIT